jgi:hypothetical protein
MENLKIEIKAEPLVIETVEHLASTLDPTLYYHSPDHTKDVLGIGHINGLFRVNPLAVSVDWIC